jgi:hypothetical protein
VTTGIAGPATEDVTSYRIRKRRKRNAPHALDYLLTQHKSARQHGYELCLFSKNCGNSCTWLSYSSNCQASNTRPSEGKIIRKSYEPRFITELRTGSR